MQNLISRDLIPRDQIFCNCQIADKKKSTLRQFINYYDLRTAYDSVRWDVLHNILIEFCTPLRLVRLIKMNLNKVHNKVCTSIHQNSSVFAIQNVLKQGNNLEHRVTKVQENQDLN
jgi:hypothetical protein